MFHRKTKIKKSMIPNIVPTSKAALKQICLITAEGDLDKAQKLYDYMIKDMDDLPLFDIPRPSTMQQIKEGANNIWTWVSQNEEQIMGMVGVIKNMFNKGGGQISIPGDSQPIPPINQ